jgi:hypothetical protein
MTETLSLMLIYRCCSARSFTLRQTNAGTDSDTVALCFANCFRMSYPVLYITSRAADRSVLAVAAGCRWSLPSDATEDLSARNILRPAVTFRRT